MASVRDHTNLPAVASAKLPRSYETAKQALAECSSIDECKDWADKAAALASYAKQADDTSLEKLALKIRARAIQRCGELLRQIEPAKNQHEAQRRAQVGADLSRKQTARDAGISERQQKIALRVAAVPKAEFEALVESENPPTVTELAERGKVAKPAPWVDLKGRDPREFAASTQVQGALEELVSLLDRHDPAVVVRGAYDRERPVMLRHGHQIVAWLNLMLDKLEGTR